MARRSVTIRVHQNIYAAVEKIASVENRSISNLVEQIISDALLKKTKN